MALIVFVMVAILMIGIGVWQLKSTAPVGFYSGEKPPREEELTDVKAWNRKHGTMWVIYGIVIIISGLVGCIIGDSIWCLIPYCGGIVVPVIIMIWYHHRLIKKYKK